MIFLDAANAVVQPRTIRILHSERFKRDELMTPVRDLVKYRRASSTSFNDNYNNNSNNNNNNGVKRTLLPSYRLHCPLTMVNMPIKVVLLVHISWGFSPRGSRNPRTDTDAPD